MATRLSAGRVIFTGPTDMSGDTGLGCVREGYYAGWGEMRLGNCIQGEKSFTRLEVEFGGLLIGLEAGLKTNG